MTTRGDAFAIATAMYAEGSIEDRSDRLYRTLDAMEAFGTDERKADLYARIEEKLPAGANFGTAVQVIAQALMQNRIAFG